MSPDRGGEAQRFTVTFDGVANADHEEIGAPNRVTVKKFGGVGDKTPSEIIIEAVTELQDIEFDVLEPLFYTVDTEALDRLFEPDSHQDGGFATLTFEYEGCTVTVHRGGEILIERQAD